MKNNINPWEVFDEIECSHNPEYIVCVSHLRHYTNIFGIDKRLIDFLGMEKNTILWVTGCVQHPVTSMSMNGNQ